VGLERIGSHNESFAVRQLGMRRLQLDALTAPAAPETINKKDTL
jgi:hypothetical protein